MVPRYQDRQAAETLILDHLPDIVTLCNRMFSQLSDAQDAAHEAVVEILHALPSYRGEGPVRHWLLKVALNAARNHRRKLARKTRREKTMTDQELPISVPANPQEDREQQEALRSAIAGLPDELREPVILYYYHRMTQAEIGQCLSCSQKTVHQRIEKGVSRLNRQLVGNSSLGMVLVASLPGNAALDAVSPTLLTAVKESIGSYFLGSAGATVTGVSGQAALGQTLVTTGITTGGIVMQAKLVAGAIAIAITCLVGGAVLSDRVFTSHSDQLEAEYATETARLQSQIEALRGDLSDARGSSATEISDLTSELERLQGQLGEKDQAIADLDTQVRDLLAAAQDSTGDPASTLSREEHWERIQDMLSGVMAIMTEMQEEGANTFQLGPRLVAELGKLTNEQFAEIMTFDEDETDPEILGVIRSVMLNAFVFIQDTAPLKNDYMDRYLQRAHDGEFEEGFSDHALRRLCFSMPPFVDGYKNIVAPLDDDLKARFVDLALDRVASGRSDSLRLDGARFLSKSNEPRATAELMRVFEHSANARSLRLTALKGLSTRADEKVLHFLRGRVDSEYDPQVLAQLKTAVGMVEKLVAR